MHKRIILLAFLLFLPFLLGAQTKSVRGVVKQASDGDPLTGVAVLAADISLYVLDVALCAMLGFRLAGLASLKNSFALWVVVAVFVTAGLIVLTYFPGKGYLFLDQRSGR